MGQQQSQQQQTDDNHQDNNNDGNVKQCYYDVLEIDQSSDDTAIKKAYRRLALLYHPDRNPDNTEQATEKFKLIQEAYDVLSDPDERKWYDNHRDTILRGNSSSNTSSNQQQQQSNSDFERQYKGYYDVDIYKYFSSSVYSNYDDSDNGFYTVYRQVFDTINSLESYDYPSFGYSYSSYDDVNIFYTQYNNFVTTRTFEWKAKWNLNDAPNRLYRRAMTDENNKLIKEAKKEYCETVRQLVQFVKKRDERVKKQQQVEQELKKQKDELYAKQQAELHKQRLHQRELHKQNEQLRFEQQEKERASAYSWAVKQEQQRNEIESQLHDNNEYICLACNKVFKSSGQLNNHENSKKHKDTVNALKRQLNKNSTANGSNDDNLQQHNNNNNDNIDQQTTVFECVICELKFTTQKKLYLHEQSITHEKRVEQVKQEMLDEELRRQEVEFNKLKLLEKQQKQNTNNNNDKPKLTAKQRKQLKKQRAPAAQLAKNNNINDNSDSDSNSDSSDSDDDNVPTRKSTIKSTTKAKRKDKKQVSSSSDSSSSNESSKSDSSTDTSSSDDSTASSSSSDNDTGSDGDSDIDDKKSISNDNADNQQQQQQPKLSAKQKKALRQEKKQQKGKTSQSLSCTVCKQSFESRTKLFKHIKDKGHAALKYS